MRYGDYSISFVMANYNYGEYIYDAIESIAAQIGRKEIIIVDDGSYDNSITEIFRARRHFQDKYERFVVVSCGTNSGKQAALNLAIPIVKGDITVIVDADDTLCGDFLQITVPELAKGTEANPKLAFVYSNCNLINHRGELLGAGQSCAFDPALIQDHSYIPECAPTWTRWLLRTLPLEEGVRVGTKHLRWRRLIELGAEGLHLPQPLFNYRMHATNLSGIGARVLSDTEKKSFILSGLWPTAEGGSLKAHDGTISL